MSIAKRTHIPIVGDAAYLSGKLPTDAMLNVAFVAYRVNPAGLRRTCRTLNAYFTMPDTLKELGAQGLLDEYSQWEYAVFQFTSANKFNIDSFYVKCVKCYSGHDYRFSHGRLFMQKDWPTPFVNATPPPVTSQRLFSLFKHLVNTDGLYLFCLQTFSSNAGTDSCDCYGSSVSLQSLLMKCLPLNMLFDDLRGAITTHIPSMGIRVQCTFKVTSEEDSFVLYGCGAWNVRAKQRIYINGSLNSTYSALLRPFEIRDRHTHRDNFRMLETAATEYLPAFPVDSMLSYMAFYVLHFLRRTIYVKHTPYTPGVRVELPVGDIKPFIANARLEPYAK